MICEDEQIIFSPTQRQFFAIVTQLERCIWRAYAPENVFSAFEIFDRQSTYEQLAKIAKSRSHGLGGVGKTVLFARKNSSRELRPEELYPGGNSILSRHGFVKMNTGDIMFDKLKLT